MSLRRRAVEPSDITRIRSVGDVQISPDGARVAFVVTTLDTERDEYLSNIWDVLLGAPTWPPDPQTLGTGPAEPDRSSSSRYGISGQPRRFTTGPKRDTAPRWSPDGRFLAFVSERDRKKKPQLYVMPASGGEATRLTDLANGVGDPVWSPDSTRVAFVARVGGWQEPDDEEEKRKPKPVRVVTTLKYKLNGEGFVYDRRPHVFVVALEGRADAPGGSEPAQITDGDFVDADPASSPDGEWLHSENDLRCPISEAEQLYVALKKLGRETALVRFPDETHELSRSGTPRHRLERFRIILEWLERYLWPERSSART